MKEEVRGKKKDRRRILTRIPGLIIECPSDFEPREREEGTIADILNLSISADLLVFLYILI
jgi:hypothetical protein